MSSHSFLEGKRVSLRPVELDDAGFLAFCANSQDIRPTFFTNYPTNVIQQEKLIKNLYMVIKRYSFLPQINTSVLLKRIPAKKRAISRRDGSYDFLFHTPHNMADMKVTILIRGDTMSVV